jgi:hypothetical protein
MGKIKLLILLFLSLFILNCTHQVRVKIINKSDCDIKNVKIIFNGGTISEALINVGTSKDFIIIPTGDSDIQIEFEESNGKKFKKMIDTYLEKGYKGEFEIIIRNGEIKWSGDAYSPLI